MTQKPWHPASEIFPMLEGRPFDELVADIREHGLREPIVLDADGQILDGRNRARACDAAGVEPRYVTWDGAGSPVAFVVSLNLHRRHLDEAQRAMVASKLATLEKGTRQDRSRDPSTPTQAESARLMHVSEKSVKRARQVQKSGVPELVEAVERGSMPLTTAAHVARLDPETQRATVARGRGHAKAQATVNPVADDEAITERLLELYGDGTCYRLDTIVAGMKLPKPALRARLDALIDPGRSHVLVDRIGRGKDATYRLVPGDHRLIDAGLVMHELNRIVEPVDADATIAKFAADLRGVIERLAKRSLSGGTKRKPAA